jgi:hypothetical protein
MRVQFIAVSQNAKTGPIPASIVERASCWPGCASTKMAATPKPALSRCTGTKFPKACEADPGRSSAQKSRRSGPAVCGAMPKQATSPETGQKIDGALLDELVAANIGKNAIAFTHKPVLGDDRIAVENRRLIAAAVKGGFTVNLSANNPAHADRLAELGIAPVVTVLARDYARRAARHRFKRRRDEWVETIGEWRDRTASWPRCTPTGRRIAICPATYSDATCKTCGACAHVRDAVIGFPAHGAWRQVEAATAARDVPAGESWVFHDHRTMAEVIAEETAAA